MFSFQHTPRFSRILWFSNTSSSSSLWFSRAKVPKGRRASCCRRPPFSRHSILSPCCPNLLLTSLLHQASRLPSSTPLSAHMPFTPPSTMPKLSLSSSLPSTYKSSQRYVHKRRLMPHTKELEDRIFLGCENAASLTQMGSLPINGYSRSKTPQIIFQGGFLCFTLLSLVYLQWQWWALILNVVITLNNDCA